MNTTTTPRPSRYCKAVCEAAAKTITPDVCQWLKDGGDDYVYPEEVTEDLAKVIALGYSDGYQLAKKLEDWHSWEPDERLVEILSSVHAECYNAHRRLQVEWVKETQPVPPVVGSMVNHQRIEGHPGIVVENHEDGTSTVCFRHLGHQLRDEPPASKYGSKTIGSILPWEELTPHCEKEEAR